MDVLGREGPGEPLGQLPLGGGARRWRLLALTWPGEPALQRSAGSLDGAGYDCSVESRTCATSRARLR